MYGKGHCNVGQSSLQHKTANTAMYDKGRCNVGQWLLHCKTEVTVVQSDIGSDYDGDTDNQMVTMCEHRITHQIN